MIDGFDTGSIRVRTSWLDGCFTSKLIGQVKTATDTVQQKSIGHCSTRVRSGRALMSSYDNQL